MQLTQIFFGFAGSARPKRQARQLDPGEWLVLANGQRVRVHYRRNARARRFILRLDREGDVRVTVPGRGTMAAAKEFLESRRDWIGQQRKEFAGRHSQRLQARARGLVWYRGREVPVTLRDDLRPAKIALGENLLPLATRRAKGAPPPSARDLRSLAEEAIRKVARQELAELTWQLAAAHHIRLRHVTIRSQRARWGSCSSQGTISLNWRLLQTPDNVRNYVILHELMHRRQLNHSDRFWAEVQAVCPDWKQAERWLKAHSELLLE